jgi:serine/threonine protein kinase
MSRHNAKKAAEQANPDFALTSIGNYMFEKTLGEGNFAKVKLAKHKLTDQEVFGLPGQRILQHMLTSLVKGGH